MLTDSLGETMRALEELEMNAEPQNKIGLVRDPADPGRYAWRFEHRRDAQGPDGEPRHWIIDNPEKGEPSLPEPASCRDGDGPYVLPIVDEQYGGVIAWANTFDQANRIVQALDTADV